MMSDIVEVIKEGEIIRMSESRAREEDLFILRRVIEPVPEPMPDSVSEQVQAQQQGSMNAASILASWQAGKPAYAQNNVVRDLKENFQWEISKLRRQRHLSRAQLGVALDVSEDVVKALEWGDLPSDDFTLIARVEHFFGVSLRKEVSESVKLADLQRKEVARTREHLERVQGRPQDAPVSEVIGDDIEIVE